MGAGPSTEGDEADIGVLSEDCLRKSASLDRQGEHYVSSGDYAAAASSFQQSLERVLQELERIKKSGKIPPATAVEFAEGLMKKLHSARTRLGGAGRGAIPADVSPRPLKGTPDVETTNLSVGIASRSSSVMALQAGATALQQRGGTGVPVATRTSSAPNDLPNKTQSHHAVTNGSAAPSLRKWPMMGPSGAGAVGAVSSGQGAGGSPLASATAAGAHVAGTSPGSGSSASAPALSAAASGRGGAALAGPPQAQAEPRHALAATRGTASAAALVAALSPEERAMVEQALVDPKPGVRPGTGEGWSMAAGMDFPKRILTEAVVEPLLNPSLFRGIRAPPKGVLLFGPPGTGKTLLAKALAAESGAAFLSISASALTGKYVGESEKQVRALFSAARKLAPCVIFIDEIDSLMSSRSAGENDASRRLKTEMLVQMDGMSSGDGDGVFVIAATNRPQELDDAMLRRLSRRVLLPLPDPASRRALVAHMMQGEAMAISKADVGRIVGALEGYSASDIRQVCQQASRGPVDDARAAARAAGRTVASINASSLRKITARDFESAVRMVRPSVLPSTLRAYEAFDRLQGSRG